MLSIIVPVFNEDESLEELHSQVTTSCRESGLEYELLFVDDGSTDRSWSLIERLTRENREVAGIRFRRNFGKAAALTAGMRAARGDRILMMDADLQDDPTEIPRFLEKMDEGYDVVNGWKERRLDPWHKVYPSRVFNWLIARLTGLKLHDHNCGFKLFRSDVAAEIRIYGEMHRFIPVLAHSRGFRVAEIPVHHRPRQFGHSKYGIRRFLRGFLDLLTVKFLTGFGQRPQHMLGAIGLFFFMLGLAGLTYLAVLWVVLRVSGVDPRIGANHAPLMIYSVTSLLVGAQGISLGFLAELIVANTNRERDAYSIADRIEHEVSMPVDTGPT